jgi:hypothetical protein
MFEELKKTAINALIKQLAPGILDNIMKSFEALIDETASKNDMSPYFIHVKIERQEKEVLAVVLWEDIVLDTFSLMEMIEETFNQSFAKVPQMMRPTLDGMMDGLSVDEIVLKHLEDCFLILRFNDEDELISYKVQGDQETLLDWMEFIANVKIDL